MSTYRRPLCEFLLVGSLILQLSSCHGRRLSDHDGGVPSRLSSRPDNWRRRLRKPPVDQVFGSYQDDDDVKVFIGYTDDTALDMIAQQGTITKQYREIRAAAVTVAKKRLAELADSSYVTYYEEDQLYYPLSQKIVPYGITLTDSNFSFVRDASWQCNHPEALRVAVIDTGIAAGHEDLRCRGPSDLSCIGASFGTSEPWYRDDSGHGTQVAGIIASRGNNKVGGQGVVNDAQLCLLVARVFDSPSNGASESDVLEAVNWAVMQGARVINVSLGSYLSSGTAAQLFADVYQKNVLVVSPSGNDGFGSVLSYPASYPSVVSVAAVDDTAAWANFSNHNYAVDVAAPGVHILSTTTPGMGSIAQITVNLTTYNAPVMNPLRAGAHRYFVSGPLVDCSWGIERCDGVDGSGYICVIQRGNATFEEKALNCQNGGGVAAIIYNNDEGPFQGVLTNTTDVSIPVVTTEYSVGRALLSAALDQPAEISVFNGFEFVPGSTSMAAAFVTGAAAVVWRACPNCTNQEILRCLKRTALDLGAPGTDEYYGSGLIQTKAAYDSCRLAACCQ